MKAKVNCIPYNNVEGLAWTRPSEARQDAFMAILREAGVPATIRREKGHDIAAACGQLRRQWPRPCERGTRPEAAISAFADFREIAFAKFFQ